MILYNELDATIKKSFQTSLAKSVEELLLHHEYSFAVERDKVSTEFIRDVFQDMKDKASFQKWAKIQFEIPDEEMAEMIEARIVKLRNKKPTVGQLDYFTESDYRD